MAKSIWDLEEEDYVDKWKTYIDDKGQEVHENEVLGMKITKLNLSEQEIEEKFNTKLADLS